MLDLKALLTKMLTWLNAPLVVEAATTTKSCSANTGTAVNITASKAGYYPLAIVAYRITGDASGYAEVRQYQMVTQAVGSGTTYMYLWNNSNAAKSWTISAHILWMKVA